jgi:ABC-type protease/lipase transport system fused ATPase/permease subunit
LLDDPSRHVLVMAVSHSITFLENFNSMMVVANNTVSEYGTRDQ